MLGRDTVFYFKTIRNTVVAFGTLFNDLWIDKGGKIVKVPLDFIPKADYYAWMVKQEQEKRIHVSTTFPRMSFEITGINPNDERRTLPQQMNTNAQSVTTGIATKEFQNHPAPYDFSLTLIIHGNNFEDCTRIVEQIYPFFNPEISLKINDVVGDNFKAKNTLTFKLDGSTQTDNHLDGFVDNRHVTFELNFSARVNFYPPIQTGNIITKSIVDVENEINNTIQTYNTTGNDPDFMDTSKATTTITEV